MNALARINRWLMLVSAVALTIMVLVTSIDVLSANLRGRPLTGVYEIVEAALIFMVFAGIPEIFRTERNITVDIVDHFVGDQAVGYLRAIAGAVSVLFLALMAWSMVGPAVDAFRFGDVKSDTGLPLWMMWVPVLLGTALSIAAATAGLQRVMSRGRFGQR